MLLTNECVLSTFYRLSIHPPQYNNFVPVKQHFKRYVHVHDPIVSIGLPMFAGFDCRNFVRRNGIIFSQDPVKKKDGTKIVKFYINKSTMILELETKENCFTIEFSMRHTQNETISLFLLRNR